jgi:hypothetical protein
MRARRGPTRLDFICDAIQRFENGATEHEIRSRLAAIDVGPPLTNPRSPLLRHLLNQYARHSWGRDLWTRDSTGKYTLTTAGLRRAKKVSEIEVIGSSGRSIALRVHSPSAADETPSWEETPPT